MTSSAKELCGKYTVFCIAFFLLLTEYFTSIASVKDTLYLADNINIQYVGRVDFRDPLKPKFWAPGVSSNTQFIGNSCELLLNDEVPNLASHNYIDIVLDNKPFKHLKLSSKTNTIKVGDNLDPGEHSLIIYKSTEAVIGYLEFIGIKCINLVKPNSLPDRKIECVGNSITCGSSMDISSPCKTGEWYDHNNAYMSYGVITARQLNAQYHLTAVSGIGLIHSCCNISKTMPMIYNQLGIGSDTSKWDFNQYQPDVVTISLGQNDGVQDSTKFCEAYIRFIRQLRKYYPKAELVCMTSPMANEELNGTLKKFILSVTNFIANSGDYHVSHYFFNKRYNHGCGAHPDVNEHVEIANELTVFLNDLMHWKTG